MKGKKRAGRKRKVKIVREVEERRCPVCREWFPLTRKDRGFCSTSCYNADYYRRNKKAS